MKEQLSVIIPCYNEQDMLPLFYNEICKTEERLSDYKIELIFIDDGSGDNTFPIILELAARDERVKYISFSRNFGKEAAIYAGLQHAKGDYVAIMDADLQDPPSMLPEMLKAVTEEGYDSAATRRVSRKGEPAVRSFFARKFYRLMHRISTTEIMDGARDYRLMTKKFRDAVLELGEYNRFSKGLFGWVGFQTKWMEYENIERKAGETKWSFWKLFMYSIEGMIGFSTMPLAAASVIGIAVCLTAFVFLIVIMVRTICFGDSTAGWTSLICVTLMLGGLQLFSVGILGAYLSKTYLETKKRPIYICDETNIDSEKGDATHAKAKKSV